MAIPAYMLMKDENGNVIKSSSHVKGRENTAEIYGMKHRIYIPTDADTGALMSTRKHEPLLILKQFCSATPILYKACSSGKTLGEVKISWYRINDHGKEEEYFRHTLSKVKIVSIAPSMDDIKNKSQESYGHLEWVGFRYEKIRWEYLEGNIATEDQWNERN
ncbi:MAG: type VI secretion system tube protein TssD [Gammaproteobacteria bacterium]